MFRSILRTLQYGLFLCVAWTAFAASNTELDPKTLGEVRDLVFRGRIMDDETFKRIVALQEVSDRDSVAKEMTLLSAELDRKVDERIRRQPGLKPYLFELLEAAAKGELHGELGLVLRALAKREDLTIDDVAVVSTEVARLLGQPASRDNPNRGYISDYLIDAPFVLQRNLTQSNEDLLIECLKRPDSYVNVAVAKVLSESCVARALPEMQATVNRLGGSSSSFGETVQQCILRLKANLMLKANEAARSPSGLEPAATLSSPSPSGLSPAVPTAARREGISWSWLWGLGMLLAGTIIVLSYVRGRRKS